MKRERTEKGVQHSGLVNKGTVRKKKRYCRGSRKEAVNPRELLFGEKKKKIPSLDEAEAAEDGLGGTGLKWSPGTGAETDSEMSLRRWT